MKQTLLELTQTILSRMDSDEVNSISDTTESRQVALCVQTAYRNIIARANLPELNKIFALLASADPSYPVLMHRPDNINKIDWIKYNTSEDSEPTFDYVTILPLQQFLDLTQELDTAADNVGTFNFNGLTAFYETDTAPTTCTVLNNKYLLFNAYNSDVETTLQESKSLCFGQYIPDFTQTDLFIPDLDDNQFPLLLNEATSLAFLELKQIVNDASVQESRRQWQNLQRTKNLKTPSSFDRLPSFGRK